MKTNILFFKKITAILLFLQVTNAYAQEYEKVISPLRFAGVHSLNREQGFADGYIVVHSASEGNWQYQLLNNQLKEIKEGKVEAPRHSIFNGLTYNGSHTLLCFVNNAFTTSITYVIIDDKGNEVAHSNRTDTPMLRRGEQFFPDVYSHPEHGFIIVQASGSGRNAGYSVEYIDNLLNTLWQKEFSVPKRTAHVFDIKMMDNKLYVLESTERMGKTQGLTIHCIDLNDGALVYTRQLRNDNLLFFPSAIKPLVNDEVILAGSYYKGSLLKPENSQGLFVMTLNEMGEVRSSKVHPWKGLRSTLRTSVPDWFFKAMPELHIHDIEQNPDGSFDAIAELYRYSGEVRREKNENQEERFHRIRLLDFMLFHLDAHGDILQTERIERPHMVIKLDSDGGSSTYSLSQSAGSGPLKRAKAMKKYGAFTYRFHQKSENMFNLAFVSYEGKRHYAYFMDLQNDFKTLKIDMKHSKPLALSYIQVVDLCINQQGFGFILAELNTRSFDESEAYHRGVLPSTDNSMVIYEYMPLNGKLKLTKQIN